MITFRKSHFRACSVRLIHFLHLQVQFSPIPIEVTDHVVRMWQWNLGHLVQFLHILLVELNGRTFQQVQKLIDVLHPEGNAGNVPLLK